MISKVTTRRINEVGTEIYTPGYDRMAIEFMSRRTMASHGHFIEPLLKPGMRILDLGCGPGTITLDLAARISTLGSVVGVDRSETQFNEARAAAGTHMRAESWPAG